MIQGQRTGGYNHHASHRHVPSPIQIPISSIIPEQIGRKRDEEPPIKNGNDIINFTLLLFCEE